MVEPVTVIAPGKVNLYLAVGAKRADGFHDLATVFQAVSLYDTITARPARAGIALTMSNQPGDLKTDATNLAVRAAQAVADAAGVDLDRQGVELHITKRIPVAGGMAGGSADAAGTLVAVDQLWGTNLGADALHELACRLGSDVPFCLLGGTAVGRGRGEVLTPVLARGTYYCLVATMLEGLSTPAVFREFDATNPQGEACPEVSSAFLHALAQGDTRLVSYSLRNDLMTPALNLHRGARHVMEFFCNNSLTVMISGSGPTLVAQVDSFEHGQVLAQRLKTWPHVADAFVVHGPVPGIECVADPAAPLFVDDATGGGLGAHEESDEPAAGQPVLAEVFLPENKPADGDLDESIARHPSSRHSVRPLLRIVKDDAAADREV